MLDLPTDALSVLWVDDDHELTDGLTDYLRGEGYAVECVLDLASAAACLKARAYDLVLVDLSLPDGSGLTLIRDTPREQAREFVVLTGHGDVKTVLQALRHQVFDYLMKPLELSELRNTLARVRKARDSSRPAAAVEPAPASRPASRAEAPASTAATMMVGRSPAMQRAQGLLDRVAGSEITVLVQGESGTGKEVAARYLHEHSARAAAPFVALNCATVSPNLIASELFGHEKGSFTGAHRQHRGIFERAENGTLFLDEITEMPLDLQATLLRALETGTIVRVGGDREIPVNARVIAATNRDPLRAVESGRFRLDLYYRLQVFPVVLPSLRERSTDLLLLAEYFLETFSGGAAPRSLSADALGALLRHDWPGNVRELRNVIERACLLSTDVIEPEHLLLPEAGPQQIELPRPGPGVVPVIDDAAPIVRLRDAERDLITRTLARHSGNKTRAAADLGISVKTLYNKLKRFEEERA
ncbi:sigma-54-dependent transcriptional regulator [Solimonas marina]|uniref:Sigma-54-dependent Fis family transcriptional regulator n=1 Tax=Solimonas marina TaxID=2714601 RepID=A0A970B7A9_9GAMM|nr:sigma-54 dependent transcriptional regulator [Solimonas marina]NKF23465.1 sigma-54-dependent Fis family transcriptional regulator [Solimonas marina]